MLNQEQVLDSAYTEPHLLTAIMTIASRYDDSTQEIHRSCSEHMTSLIASVVYTGPTSVEAVEALLILAEWTPQRFQSRSNVGTGEEDRAAWMQVGLAVRLAYLQGLDSTSFESYNPDETEPHKRCRVAWAGVSPVISPEQILH